MQTLRLRLGENGIYLRFPRHFEQGANGLTTLSAVCRIDTERFTPPLIAGLTMFSLSLSLFLGNLSAQVWPPVWLPVWAL